MKYILILCAFLALWALYLNFRLSRSLEEIAVIQAEKTEAINKFKECKDEKETYIQAKQRAENTIGEVVTDSTKKNLEMRVDAENGATAGKFDLAKRAKAANLDAIHDTVHEMARDEARHGKAFEGLLKRYFG